MRRALVIEIRGVCVSEEAHRIAGIAAVARTLRDPEVAMRFRCAAWIRRFGSSAGLVPRAARDAGVVWSPEEECQAVRTARGAVPRLSSVRRQKILRLLEHPDVAALVDAASPDWLDAVVDSWQLPSPGPVRLWLARLGRQAQPPSRLGFAWAARRLGLDPEVCTLVSVRPGSRQGARAAGWSLLPDRWEPGCDPLRDLAAVPAEKRRASRTMRP